MFNVEELAKLAEAKQNVCKPLIEGGKLVQHNGYFYPMVNGKLLNPLDAYNLIGTCDPYDTTSIDRLFKTLQGALDIVKAGCTIVARLNSKAPRVVQVGGDNGTVVILGDYAKEKDLYYPLLTALLADGQWDFDGLWGAYGFKRPQFPNFCIDLGVYTLNDRQLIYKGKSRNRAYWKSEPAIVARPQNVWEDEAKDF